MPMGSTIGLDLLPIRRIRASSRTRRTVRILRPRCADPRAHGSNADVVLCDGAPDAAGGVEQGRLRPRSSPSSRKLATEFLKRGGIFITRSFVLVTTTPFLGVSRLFKRVDSMPSSRSSSAEIFVGCRDG